MKATIINTERVESSNRIVTTETKCYVCDCHNQGFTSKVDCYAHEEVWKFLNKYKEEIEGKWFCFENKDELSFYHITGAIINDKSYEFQIWFDGFKVWFGEKRATHGVIIDKEKSIYGDKSHVTLPWFRHDRYFGTLSSNHDVYEVSREEVERRLDGYMSALKFDLRTIGIRNNATDKPAHYVKRVKERAKNDE